jgi:hypothetical protein
MSKQDNDPRDVLDLASTVVSDTLSAAPENDGDGLSENLAVATSAISSTLSALDHARSAAADRPDSLQLRKKANEFRDTVRTLRAQGRPPTKLESGKIAEEQGLEAAMREFNISKRTAANNRLAYRQATKTPLK